MFMKGILKGSFEQNRFKLPIIRKGFPVYISGCLTTHYKAVNNERLTKAKIYGPIFALVRHELKRVGEVEN